MHLLWVSFAEMSFKELILCFRHTHQLCIFKGLQHGRRKKSHDKLLSITKPQQSTNRMHCSGTEVTELCLVLHSTLLC